jgi:hypothetical protein
VKLRLGSVQRRRVAATGHSPIPAVTTGSHSLAYTLALIDTTSTSSSPAQLLLNFALDYAIRYVHGIQERLRWNGTRQLLAYAHAVNLLGDYIETINKNTDTLIDASKEVGLVVYIDKTRYILVYRDRNAVPNRDVKMENAVRKCGTDQIFGGDSNKSKFDSDGNLIL